MKKVLVLAGALVCAATFAFAQGGPAPLGKGDGGGALDVPTTPPAAAPNIPPRATPPAAVLGGPAPLGDPCKAVRVMREDLERPIFFVNFRGFGGNVEAIQACNSESDRITGASNVLSVRDTGLAGAQVQLRRAQPDAPGLMKLPSNFNDGDASLIVCSVNDAGEVVYRYYKAAWTKTLPDYIRMTNQPIPGDPVVFRKNCYEKGLSVDLKQKVKIVP